MQCAKAFCEADYDHGLIKRAVFSIIIAGSSNICVKEYKGEPMNRKWLIAMTVIILLTAVFVIGRRIWSDQPDTSESEPFFVQEETAWTEESPEEESRQASSESSAEASAKTTTAAERDSSDNNKESEESMLKMMIAEEPVEVQ